MIELIEAVTIKKAFRYLKNAGDRMRVTRNFIDDKSKLSDANLTYVKSWFSDWNQSQSNPKTPGGKPVFEEKFKNKKTGLMIFGVEIHRQNPSIHMIVYINKTSPIVTKRGVKLSGGNNLFIFDRVFDSYVAYNKYLDSLR